MGLFSFLSGKAPEEIELIGDNYFNNNEFGAAKIEYEKAFNKAESKFPEKQNLIQKLREKIESTKESLAEMHLENAKELIDADLYHDAEDLLHLAFELTEDKDLKDQINTEIEQLIDDDLIPDHEHHTAEGHGLEPGSTGDSDNIDEEEEYFSILCNALPDDVRDSYHNYGPAFKEGFIALNNGDFETAAERLSLAFEEDASSRPLIPLELSTALINLGKYDRAINLLENFVNDHPNELRGYQMLCDIYWVSNQHSAAVSMLESCPESIGESFHIKTLLGETFYQMKRYPEAESVFLQCEADHGFNEIITRALAKTLEAMGQTEKARDKYGELLNGWAKCGVRTDPYVKMRFAELCFKTGERSQRLLEIYLSLAQEDDDNKDEYFHRIHTLYQALGNEKEAVRFKSFIED